MGSELTTSERRSFSFFPVLFLARSLQVRFQSENRVMLLRSTLRLPFEDVCAAHHRRQATAPISTAKKEEKASQHGRNHGFSRARYEHAVTSRRQGVQSALDNGPGSNASDQEPSVIVVAFPPCARTAAQPV